VSTRHRMGSVQVDTFRHTGNNFKELCKDDYPRGSVDIPYENKRAFVGCVGMLLYLGSE